MNKVLKTLLVLGLAVAVATPALAEFKFNGYFRTAMYSVIQKDGTEEGDSQQFVTQRFRAKLTNTLNENVSIVYYGEVDTDWGVNRYANSSLNAAGDREVGVGGGGQRGADGINVETKNVYLDLKFDNTKATIGVQTMRDGMQGIVFFDDMAGIKATQTYGDTAVTAIYSKWDEGADWGYPTGKSNWDDTDFYGLVVNQKFSDAFKAGLELYWYDQNTETATGHSQADVYFYGPTFAFTQDNLSIDGFLVFQDGDAEVYNTTTKVKTTNDVDGFALSAKAKMKIDGGDIGLRLMYFTDDDDAKDQGKWQGFYGAYEFVGENLQQFLCDAYVTDANKHRYALTDAAAAGYGLFGAVASGNHNLSDTMYFKWGAGYFMSLEEKRDNEAVKSRQGDTLGYEVSARVGKKFFDKVDVSLNASYAGYGDFYDDQVTDDKGLAADPDSTYQAYLMVNVPF